MSIDLLTEALGLKFTAAEKLDEKSAIQWYQKAATKADQISVTDFNSKQDYYDTLASYLEVMAYAAKCAKKPFKKDTDLKLRAFEMVDILVQNKASNQDADSLTKAVLEAFNQSDMQHKDAIPVLNAVATLPALDKHLELLLCVIEKTNATQELQNIAYVAAGIPLLRQFEKVAHRQMSWPVRLMKLYDKWGELNPDCTEIFATELDKLKETCFIRNPHAFKGSSSGADELRYPTLDHCLYAGNGR